MEKILIIGCSGSGKSTLAVALGEKLGLPVVHLDQLWWKEGWRNVTREEFDSRLAMAMNMGRMDHRRKLQPHHGNAAGEMRHRYLSGF